jgi:hypothetical protein
LAGFAAKARVVDATDDSDWTAALAFARSLARDLLAMSAAAA